MASGGETENSASARGSLWETLRYTETQGKAASSHASGSMEEYAEKDKLSPLPAPKHKTRHVSFNMEIEQQEYSVRSEEDDWCPLTRSEAFRLRDVDPDSSVDPSPQSARDALGENSPETQSGSQAADSSVEPSPQSARDALGENLPETQSGSKAADSSVEPSPQSARDALGENLPETQSGSKAADSSVEPSPRSSRNNPDEDVLETQRGSMMTNKRERALDQDVSKTPSGFHTIVPEKQERAPSSMSVRFRAVMKRFRLPTFKALSTSQRVCPESSQ
eukprot:TRINITY_DN16718_c0_g1_i1.p1 TRINITY_DN16718_c0_g1~~TRINITY_DN16718_c0_g1_i1.p1  ORF type:complete len:278 (-),score=45.51 TRINITY_DN16718_c0_g1_i1:294-1127(-)